MTTHRDPLALAEDTAHTWLAAVAQELGADDRHQAYRTLRAWLHVVRDRLSVEATVHLGAQLPELFRGILFEDWTPNRPVRRGTAAELVDEFAHSAQLSDAEAQQALGAVTFALQDLFSAGQLEHALVQLPKPLRSAVCGGIGPAAAR